MKFKTNKRIDIDDLFKDIGKISTIPTKNLTPLLDTWTMDLNNNNRRILGQSPKLIIRKNKEKNQVRDLSLGFLAESMIYLPQMTYTMYQEE